MNVTPYGLEWRKPVGRLEEAINVMRLLWSTDRPVDFHGDFFSLEDAVLGLDPFEGRAPQICGTPEMIADQIRAYQQAGLRDAILWNITPFADPAQSAYSFRAMRDVRRLLDEVADPATALSEPDEDVERSGVGQGLTRRGLPRTRKVAPAVCRLGKPAFMHAAMNDALARLPISWSRS